MVTIRKPFKLQLHTSRPVTLNIYDARSKCPSVGTQVDHKHTVWWKTVFLMYSQTNTERPTYISFARCTIIIGMCTMLSSTIYSSVLQFDHFVTLKSVVSLLVDAVSFKFIPWHNHDSKTVGHRSHMTSSRLWWSPPPHLRWLGGGASTFSCCAQFKLFLMHQEAQISIF